MKKNEAQWDRVIRIAVGIGILSLAFVGPETPFAYLGLIPIMTGLMGWCPMYQIFSVATCPLHNKK
jgi:hypothetical protein